MVIQKKAKKLSETKVRKRQNVTEDLMLLWIEKPDGFTFKPGQYCTIGIDGIERAYSIVSAPHEDLLELFIELVPLPEGMLTPKLWTLKVGDSLTIRPRAKGIFTLDLNFSNQLLVATVTGIVPYVSYIRDYIHNRNKGHRFYVFQGSSYKHEFTYDSELISLSSQYPELISYIPTISRPNERLNDGWHGVTGRVNLILETYMEEFGLSSDDTIVYACGHPQMIEDIKSKLNPNGFVIKEERYWKED